MVRYWCACPPAFRPTCGNAFRNTTPRSMAESWLSPPNTQHWRFDIEASVHCSHRFTVTHLYHSRWLGGSSLLHNSTFTFTGPAILSSLQYRFLDATSADFWFIWRFCNAHPNHTRGEETYSRWCYDAPRRPEIYSLLGPLLQVNVLHPLSPQFSIIICTPLRRPQLYQWRGRGVHKTCARLQNIYE